MSISDLKKEIKQLKRELQSCRRSAAQKGNRSDRNQKGQDKARRRKRFWPELLGEDAEYAKGVILEEMDNKVDVIFVDDKDVGVSADFVKNRVRIFVDYTTNTVARIPKRG